MIEDSNLNLILFCLTNTDAPVQPIVQRSDGLFVFCNNIRPEDGGVLGTNLSGEYLDSEGDVHITILGTWYGTVAQGSFYEYNQSIGQWHRVSVVA